MIDFSFHFLRPWCLLLLLLGGAVLYLINKKNQRTAWDNLMDESLFSALTISQTHSVWLSPMRLACACLFLWVLCLSGPTWQKKHSPLAEDAAPLVIVLSLSESMLENDILPNRLTQAKYKIQQLLTSRQQGKTALLVYAGSAHTVLPLTEDVAVIEYYLHSLEPNVMPKQGNDVKQAIALAEQQLENRIGSILLINDKPVSFASQAVKTIQLMINPFVDVDSNGVKQITYTADQQDIKKIEKQINRDWQQQLSQQGENQWKDMGYYLLWPLLLLMSVWFRRAMVLQ